jgi:hypothetical protein
MLSDLVKGIDNVLNRRVDDPRFDLEKMHAALARAREGLNHQNQVSWSTGMVYIVDWFLWKMANYGYTLQKSRKKIEFYDPDEVIDAKRQKEMDELVQLLEQKAAEKKSE